MRVLIGAAPEAGTGVGVGAGEVDDERLAELYAAPRTPWVRVNMVSTVDGSATGEGGLTGAINNEPDHRVFDLLRRQADVVVVGAGTARAEGYTALDLPLVLVSRGGAVPPRLRGAEPGRVLMATCEQAEHLDETRALLGEEQVLVLGSHRVDLPLLRDRLVDRGWGRILCEGGPHLLRDLVAEGVADEICCTTVPHLVAGEHPRITDGPPVDVPLELHTLLEQDGTLLARWFLHHPHR
ncbi:dihydrofolate reductase family protein [Nocardioides panaciterrulae]|uniref:Riboflavin biosynthesis pyrimidine reductase n=1 Tax=Nocardioides panaciterrulae TaxID=661492 RepID=A0A7Y9J9N8_9ACTN|nr:dihydrofolate reductase family protein [Nocardioides panaciterrulae]NYD40538.1 riboflavin biosynthesis pyrimidine reductase [Nocardioides panaciterrulae]